MAMFKVSPNVQAKRQPLSTCCWLTCLEMLFEWKNDKRDILATMDGSSWLDPYMMKRKGISPGECRETAKMLGLKYGYGKIEADVLHNCLVMHGPMWVAGDWARGQNEGMGIETDKNDDNSHVIVVTGCDPANGQIKYIDPWNNFTMSESTGTISWLTQRSARWKNCDGGVMYW